MGLPVEVNNLMLGSLGGYTVGRSLRFRASASAYLNRTPASAGNRTTWTWSGWYKRSRTDTSSVPIDYLFDGGAWTGSGECPISFYNDTLNFSQWDGTTNTIQLRTTQVFRDPAAWYHIVVVADTTQATASNRIKMYVNGVQITAFSIATYPSLNYNTGINTTATHAIGRWQTGAARYLDGYLAEVNFIDGQALTPSSFGAYDTNGVWQPKKYSGTYGTNGFYLPFTSGLNTTQAYVGSFSGSGQFLNVAASASLAPSTGDFTIEANVNFNVLPVAGVFTGIFENQIATTSATSDKFWFGLYNSSGQYQLRIGRHNAPNGSWSVWTPTIGTWYHVAVVRQSGVISIYINGVSQTMVQATDMAHSFSQNGASFGAASNTGSPAYFNGYISNARYVVGSAVYTTGFTPPSSNLTNITNTQWLTLQNATIIDNSSAARTITNNGSVVTSNQYPFQYTLASISADYSGNNNNWTTNNINATFLGTTYDSMIDSPTNAAGTSTGIGNYCTWNPLQKGGSISSSDANLTTTNTADSKILGTIGVSSGKWYWEATVQQVGALAGIAQADSTLSIFIGGDTKSWAYYFSNGNKYTNNTPSAYGAACATGDVVGVAFDADNGTLTFYKNGVSQGTAFTGLTSGPYFPCTGNGTATVYHNFGQRPFAYTPPSGFKALNTYNLPAPSIAAGNKHFDISLWTGTGVAQAITNSGGFQPDLVWNKSRNNAGLTHIWTDSVRGVNSQLFSPLTNAQETRTDRIQSFDSSGFTVGTYTDVNQSAQTFVGWQWKGGGTGVTNTAGTITSTVSANTTAGFSVVTYTGTGANATIGHGLGVAPQMIIVKKRNAAGNSWRVYHVGLTSAAYSIELNTTAAQALTADVWNSTVPTSSVFSVGVGGDVNASGATYVAYCFSAVSGYSAFGKYTGNGSTDGPFVFTNFRPRWVLIRASNLGSAENWYIHDTSRSTYNVSDLGLFPNLSNAEGGTGVSLDILSNGFKPRSTATPLNSSGTTYIYAAFAENPFNYSRAR